MTRLDAFQPTAERRKAFDDLLLSSMVWAALSADARTRSANIRVAADGGDVFITGSADNAKALDAVTEVAGAGARRDARRQRSRGRQALAVVSGLTARRRASCPPCQRRQPHLSTRTSPSFRLETQAVLEEIRALIRAEAPAAAETISYAIPTFDLHGKHLCHFAAFKKHLSFFPTARARTPFAAELERVQGRERHGAVPVRRAAARRPHPAHGRVPGRAARRRRGVARSVQLQGSPGSHTALRG